MSNWERYRDWRARVHKRVCEPARACTCPGDYGDPQPGVCREFSGRSTFYGPAVITAARDNAARVHARCDHPGTVTGCESPHDVICKAVWP